MCVGRGEIPTRTFALDSRLRISENFLGTGCRLVKSQRQDARMLFEESAEKMVRVDREEGLDKRETITKHLIGSLRPQC